MWIANILNFHTAIHQTFTGLCIGIVYYFWLRAEIGYYRDRAPWKLLVWAGRWSYSLYLMHPIIVGLCLRYNPLMLESRLGWIVAMAVILLGSYMFYLIVERPSHNFARKIPIFGPKRFGKNAAYFKTF
jgi:peptidoglycan/LPS O-acetylase OafA/YrhL